MKDKDKIMGAIYAHVDDAFTETVMAITENILAIQEEEAKERYEEAKVFLAKEWGWDISAMYHATSTMEALRIASGYKPTK